MPEGEREGGLFDKAIFEQKSEEMKNKTCLSGETAFQAQE